MADCTRPSFADGVHGLRLRPSRAVRGTRLRRLPGSGDAGCAIVIRVPRIQAWPRCARRARSGGFHFAGLLPRYALPKGAYAPLDTREESHHLP